MAHTLWVVTAVNVPILSYFLAKLVTGSQQVNFISNLILIILAEKCIY